MRSTNKLADLRRFASVEAGTLRGLAAEFLVVYIETGGGPELAERHAELLDQYGQAWLKMIGEVAGAYGIRMEITEVPRSLQRQRGPAPERQPRQQAPEWEQNAVPRRPAPGPAGDGPRLASLRRFSTTGSASSARHHVLDPLDRLPRLAELAVHEPILGLWGPPGSGKSTALAAVARRLRAEDAAAVVHLGCAAPGAAGDDDALLAAIEVAAARQLSHELRPPRGWRRGPPGQRLGPALASWAEACPLPVLVLLDGLEELSSPLLGQVLAAARDPTGAHLLLAARRDPARLIGGMRSLRLSPFTSEEVAALLEQHAGSAGQPVEPPALARIHELSAGLPALVCALAQAMVESVAPPHPVTRAQVDDAAEFLVRRGHSPLERLRDHLRDPGVQRVLGAVISGEVAGDVAEDLPRTRALGLVAPDAPLRFSSPLVAEVVLRELLQAAEVSIADAPRAFLRPDGLLDWRRILEDFATFWQEHGGALLPRMPVPQVAPQLVLMGWLERVANGALVERRMAAGQGGAELVVQWPVPGPRGRREPAVVAVTARTAARPDPLPPILRRLDDTLDQLGPESATLVAFDMRPDAPSLAERLRFETARTPRGRAVVVLWA